ARQVGKSTLTGMLGQERDTRFITLDDPDALALAKEDPKDLVGMFPQGLLVIDEAQRAPGIILPLKIEVDSGRRPGQFVLTGSADLLRVKGVGDSLAGRAETVEMMPLSQGELSRRAQPEDFVTWILADPSGQGFPELSTEAVILGGFPAIANRSPQRVRRWFKSYINRLSDHDARELQGGGFADQLAALLGHLATLGQSELVKVSIARHLSVAESTVDSYVRLARTMRLVYQFQAWNRAPHRRIVRRPKVCLIDTGLSAALAGFSSEMAMAPGGRQYYGSLVEQFVALELTKQQAWSHTPFELFHFRDLDGAEVDLVIETWAGDLIAIEVKATRTPSTSHWSGLKAFKEWFPDRNVTGVLLHTGDFVARLQGWLHILPITSLWQHEI
ncbi:MAG: ATP-binding protein, partial [Micrococcales bacterium]|nr:ATP-binding protein [Micrococcales bacterium]